MRTRGEIEGSPIGAIYRVARKSGILVRLFVTADQKIWIGYGSDPEVFLWIAVVGDRHTHGRTRDAVCRAANTW